MRLASRRNPTKKGGKKLKNDGRHELLAARQALMCASPRNVTRGHTGHVSGANVSSHGPRGATRMNQFLTLSAAPGCRAPFSLACMFQHGVIFFTPIRKHKTTNKFNDLHRHKMRGRRKACAGASYRIETKSPVSLPVLAPHRPRSHAAERFEVFWHTPCFERCATQAYRRHNDLANDSGLWGRQAERIAATGSGKHKMRGGRNEKT